MKRLRWVVWIFLGVVSGCFPTVQAPVVIPVSDLAPSVAGGAPAKEPVYAVVVDRFRDERSNRSILGQYDHLGKGGFAGTTTITSDRDITEVFEETAKKAFLRKGILSGPSPFILKGAIKKANVGASPDSQVIKADVFLELSIVSVKSGAYLWRKSYLGSASGIDPKRTLANAFQDLAIAIDQDDSPLVLREFFLAQGGKIPQAAASSYAQAQAAGQPISDVDELPAVSARPNKNAYAVVIGIEQYRQKLPPADFAAHDAQIMTKYLTKVLGYLPENVITLVNEKATRSDFDKYLGRWLHNNVEKGGSVFVYYSGHGAPNPVSQDAYLVPYDGDPTFIDETGYSLKKLYEQMGKLPAAEVIVALDACFSGAGGRSVLAKGARPLVMNLQETWSLPANVAVFAAAGGNQISSTYHEKSHGLFTYFLLKGIKEANVLRADGSIALEALHTFMTPQVERIAKKQYNHSQTPQLIKVK